MILWISLPHLALHFRRRRNFDFKLDGGFALAGLCAALATLVVWE